MSTTRNQIERRLALTAAELISSGISFEVIDTAAAPNVCKKRIKGNNLQQAIQRVIEEQTSYTADGAITIQTGTALISKTSAAAMTLAAPTAAQAGTRLLLVSTTAYAHVVTATSLLEDGKTGGTKSTLTLPAFVGAAVLLEAVALKWTVVATNFDPQDVGQTDYSADGAIAIIPGTALLSKTSAAAMTLAAPTAAQNGTRLTILSTTAYAHVITATSLIEDGATGGTKSAITLPAFVGASVVLEAVGLKWTVVARNFQPGVAIQTAYAADGAITIAPGTALLTKAGVGAYTLAAPTAAQAGTRVNLINQTENAHVVTATGLLDDGVTGGAKNTATFGAFVGASLTLEAVALKWAVVSKNVCTIA